MATHTKCQCSKSLKEPNLPCPHNAIKGSPYCGYHQTCHKIFTQPLSSSNMVKFPLVSPKGQLDDVRKKNVPYFDLVDDYVLKNVCEQLIQQNKYAELGVLVRTNQRFKRVCQPLLDQARLLYHIVVIDDVLDIEDGTLDYQSKYLDVIRGIYDFIVSYRDSSENSEYHVKLSGPENGELYSSEEIERLQLFIISRDWWGRKTLTDLQLFKKILTEEDSIHQINDFDLIYCQTSGDGLKKTFIGLQKHGSIGGCQELMNNTDNYPIAINYIKGLQIASDFEGGQLVKIWEK